MNVSFLRALMLVLSLVFASSASAFMHVHELQHIQEYDLSHDHAVEQHQYDEQEVDHEDHCHVHIIGDLISHSGLISVNVAPIKLAETHSRLSLRTYAPPIPPPNVLSITY
jgi:hypothetical protein